MNTVCEPCEGWSVPCVSTDPFAKRRGRAPARPLGVVHPVRVQQQIYNVIYRSGRRSLGRSPGTAARAGRGPHEIRSDAKYRTSVKNRVTAAGFRRRYVKTRNQIFDFVQTAMSNKEPYVSHLPHSPHNHAHPPIDPHEGCHPPLSAPAAPSCARFLRMVAISNSSPPAGAAGVPSHETALHRSPGSRLYR